MNCEMKQDTKQEHDTTKQDNTEKEKTSEGDGAAKNLWGVDATLGTPPPG